MSANRFASMLLLAALLVLAAGCSDDDSNPVTPVQQTVIDTPQKLMLAFREAYAVMDDEAYADLLDDRYVFYYLDGLDHDHTTEVRITENMFSGNPPTNPNPFSMNTGIRSIDVITMHEVEQWRDVSSSHPDFGSISGAKRGYYNVQVVFHHDAGTITVWGQQFFYAVPTDELIDGEVVTTWKLLGQEDIAKKAANENWAWGELKAMFQ